mgnify:CR=1 FL=1
MTGAIGPRIRRFRRCAVDGDDVGLQGGVHEVVVVPQIERHLVGDFGDDPGGVFREGQVHRSAGVILERNIRGSGLADDFVGIVNGPLMIEATRTDVAGVFLGKQRVELVRLGRNAGPARGTLRFTRGWRYDSD